MGDGEVYGPGNLAEGSAHPAGLITGPDLINIKLNQFFI